MFEHPLKLVIIHNINHTLSSNFFCWLNRYIEIIFNRFFQDEDRRSLLRGLNDDQYKDVIRVLALIPFLDMQVS